MVRLEDVPEPVRSHIAELELKTPDHCPPVSGPPLSERKIALITTAGLHLDDDPPFSIGSADFRRIPNDVPADRIRMSHLSVNFDRTGFYQDLNVVFPLERLAGLADQGVIGSCADEHYSFMGATEPWRMQHYLRELCDEIKTAGVDGVLLVPI